MIALASPQSNILDEVIHGEALAVLRTLPDNSVDAIVCDPPGNLKFMGKKWDDYGSRDQFIFALRAIMAEALRVLKPGGHAFIWALPKTSHYTAMALEDAGFTIREKCYHLFGSGMPKSLNVSKVLQAQGYDVEPGLGTGLKPSAEEWILARKPLAESSIAANVLEWGVGGLAIDACRVGNEPRINQPAGNKPGGASYNMSLHGMPENAEARPASGRWPANLLLSHSVWCVPNGVKKVKGTGGGWNGLGNTHNESQWRLNNPDGINRQNSEDMEQVEDWLCDESCPIRLLDEQSGMRGDSYRPNGMHGEGAKSKSMFFDGTTTNPGHMGYSDRGGSSRYFQRFYPFIYQAKASRSERSNGLDKAVKLRDDLTPEQREYVMSELAKIGGAF